MIELSKFKEQREQRSTDSESVSPIHPQFGVYALLALYQAWAEYSSNESVDADFTGNGRCDANLKMDDIRKHLIQLGLITLPLASDDQVLTESSVDTAVITLADVNHGFPQIQETDAYADLNKAWSECQREIERLYRLKK